jgi:O-antigen/teichoic acid export membrane protein
MPNNISRLTGGRRLAHNVFWNLLGTGAPLLVGLFAIPKLIEGAGTARFGVLTLAWMVVGYFSLFDLGIGRALTKLVAEKLGKGQNQEIPELIWTAMSLMVVLGVLGSIAVAGLSPWLVGAILKIPAELQAETLIVFYLLAASVPIVIGSTGLRGILEAHQRFGMVNAVRIPLGIFTFLGPVAVLPFSNSLVPMVSILVVIRLASCLAYLVFCLRIEPDLRLYVNIHRSAAIQLLSFGGWMTLTNVVGPVMVYLDRFVIGAMISMTAVAYYATPYEVITKLWIVPVGLMGVMFPAFATVLVQDRGHTARLFFRTVNYIFLSIFPMILIIVTFAYEGLDFWLGSEFAVNSSLVLKLLAVGVFINSHAQVPFGLLQSAGRPDLTGKLHLIELPFYLLLLWWMLSAYGIAGAAIAWVLRMAVDAVFLFVLANRILSTRSPFTLRPVLMACIALLTIGICGVVPGLAMKGSFLLVVLILFVTSAWFFILETDDKNRIRNHLRKIHISS